MASSADEHFYVTLPSNSSFQYYGVQDVHSYRTRLHAPIRLPPQDWEVGLTEFTYPRTWACLPDAKVKVLRGGRRTAQPVLLGSFLVPDTRYEGPGVLIETINTQLQELISKTPPPIDNAIRSSSSSNSRSSGSSSSSSSNSSNSSSSSSSSSSGGRGRGPSTRPPLGIVLTNDGRCEWTLPEDHMVVLSGELANPLGFGTEKEVALFRGNYRAASVQTARTLMILSNKELIKSPFVVKADRLVSELYVYADIAERQLVGDALAPLLRSIADTSTRSGEIVTADFPQIHYVPLRIGSFESIGIRVADTLGRPVRFLFGEVTAKLHFRRKKRRV